VKTRDCETLLLLDLYERKRALAARSSHWQQKTTSLAVPHMKHFLASLRMGTRPGARLARDIGQYGGTGGAKNLQKY
jgi:hypothetical protein